MRLFYLKYHSRKNSEKGTILSDFKNEDSFFQLNGTFVIVDFFAHAHYNKIWDIYLKTISKHPSNFKIIVTYHTLKKNKPKELLITGESHGKSFSKRKQKHLANKA